MVRIWIHQGFADIEEEYDGSEKEINDEINPSSLRLYTRDGHLLSFSVITPQQEQQFNHDEIVTVIKSGQSYEGILQSFSDEIVTILIDNNKMTIRRYDEIIYTMATYLRTRISSPEPGFLRYQTSSLTWSCQGDIFLSEDNKLSYLTSYAVITNTHRLGKDQTLQQLILVAGKQPTSREPVYYEQSAKLQGLSRSDRPASIGNPTEPTFDDYMTFPVDLDQVPIGSFYLPLFSFDLSKNQRVYFYDLQKERSPVRVGYLFNAPQDFPSCQINVHDASGMFVGSSQLDEKRKGEDVRLYLGETSTIITKTYLTNEEIPIPGNTFWSNTKVTITSQVKNTKENIKPEVIIARYYVGRSKITQSKCQGVVTDDGYLEITLTLNPGEEKTFTCSFILEA